MRGEQRAEGLTLLPGGPDGPGSPVGPGDPWLGGKDTEHQKFVMSGHRAEKTLGNSVLSVASPAWPPLW